MVASRLTLVATLLTVAIAPLSVRAREPVPLVSFVESSVPSEETSLAPVTAIGVRAADQPAEETVHVVILFDTSATQVGHFRRGQFDALAGILNASRTDDRFTIAAVDVDCTILAEGFRVASDDALREARRLLEDRTPLGATDFARVLEAAAAHFDTTATARRIVYIGDGPGLGAVDATELATALASLRSRRISFSSVGIGPQLNWSCLAATANATGGSLVIPETAERSRSAGETVATKIAQRVLWPAETLLSTDLPDAPLRMLPESIPPLRADRDSIVLVYGPFRGGRMEIVFNEGEGEDGRPSAVLDVPSVEPRDENAYLVEMVRNAWESGGAFLPLLGRDGLDTARLAIRSEAATLAVLARQATTVGATASAVRLAEASLRRDPDNQDAVVARQAALAQRDNVDAAAGADTDILPRPAIALPAGDPAEIQAQLDRRNAAGQQIEREVGVAIRNARQLLVDDPDTARDRLKETQELVRLSSDLDEATRSRLERQLESRIRESVVRSREKIDRDLANERRAATGLERARLNTELRRREDHFLQLAERYNALVEKGIEIAYAQSEYYPAMIGEEAVIGSETPTRVFLKAERGEGEEMAKAAPNLWAGRPMPMTAREVARTAPLVARILHYDSQNYRTRRDQERGFMDMLHEVDVSAIPFPTEPPIVYPSPSRWRDITELRQKYRSVDLGSSSENEKKVYDALEKNIPQNFNFNETPFIQALESVGQAFDITIMPDLLSLTESGFNAEEATVTLELSGVRLRSALRILLQKAALQQGADERPTYVVKDEVLLVTSKEFAERNENLVRKVYPVADLVIPLNPGAAINPFMQGGGIGGANAMGGPGAQAAGMNGMGGGMPGLGAPGGFCWVAREVYGSHDPRWRVFRSWMMHEAPDWLRQLYAAHGRVAAEWLRDKPFVKSVLRGGMNLIVEPRLTTAPPPVAHAQVAGAKARLSTRHDPESGRSPSTTAPPSPRGQGFPMTLVAASAVPPAVEGGAPHEAGLPEDVLGAADLRSALVAYLDVVGNTEPENTAEATSPQELATRCAQIRVSALQLGRQKQFDKAATLIEAAITAGHVEPWMYESLALALEASGHSREHVDRVLLSSADFASTSTDLLQLAQYLARAGSDRHAIRICRQITRIDPVNREAYALAMTLATRSDDDASLMWSCPGVLSHEWPAAQQEMVTRAARLAKATIGRLESAGLKDQADALRRAVEQALVRDLVVDVTWTGDADVDLLVEEPPGTVCSRGSPQSISGGQLLADEQCISPKTTSGGVSPVRGERYTATEAFPGTYKILVRRIAGRVAADTITVEMTLMRGTDREQRLRRQVPVTADEQLLIVEVPFGRRQQPLFEAQIAEDVHIQRQIGRTLLRQQLSALNDPATMAELSHSRGGIVELNASQPESSALPFFRGAGAIGYQPIVSTLPEGTNLEARAVISADRRYVRITVTPLFSGVGQVTQFNFSGGGAQGTGGMGGGGMGGGGMGGGGMGGGGMGGGGMGGMGGGGMGGGGMGGMGGGGMAGGGMGGGMGGGGMGGGMGGGFCWVAREVYGPTNPRWLLFRAWLLSADAPSWLRELYGMHGEAFAAWIHDKPAIKTVLRLLMDSVIESAASRATMPCPASE